MSYESRPSISYITSLFSSASYRHQDLGRQGRECQGCAGGLPLPRQGQLSGRSRQVLALSGRRQRLAASLPGLSYVRRDLFVLMVGACRLTTSTEGLPVVTDSLSLVFNASFLHAIAVRKRVGTLGSRACWRRAHSLQLALSHYALEGRGRQVGHLRTVLTKLLQPNQRFRCLHIG
jgi:hypothetical protein